MTHPDLPQLDAAELQGELEASKWLLEQNLGRPVNDLSYPNGNFDQAVVNVSARYYRSAVTTNCGGVRPIDSKFTLNRISADELNLKWTKWLLAMHTGNGHKC
jgi:peptidoglycan/xylan/chitin deacetylase (PgdA/CDA1 family)